MVEHGPSEAIARYRCPNGHEWWSVNDDPPLVNIKCPNCGVTAMRLHKARPAPRWAVQPLRILVADVPADPTESSSPDREGAE